MRPHKRKHTHIHVHPPTHARAHEWAAAHLWLWQQKRNTGFLCEDIGDKLEWFKKMEQDYFVSETKKKEGTIHFPDMLV